MRRRLSLLTETRSNSTFNADDQPPTPLPNPVVEMRLWE